MGFSEIIGHRRQLEVLRSGLESGRLHHAYLFAGPDGVGKRTVALALAKALHCDEAGNDFCGGCANCARIRDGNHPDLRLVEILDDKKEITIQQVRDLEKELNFRSFSGKKKIVIIDPATSMNLSAQNALLKTLEEPPRDSLLILLAANAGALLPTLRSRCLRLVFGPLPRSLMVRFLTAHQGINREKAELRAAMSMGSLGAAMDLDADELLDKRQGWLERLSNLAAGDYRAASKVAEEIASDKQESLRFLEWAETWYRDLLVYASTGNSEDVINADMFAEIELQSARGDFERLLSTFAQTAAAGARIQRNLNRRMVLESLLFNVVEGG